MRDNALTVNATYLYAVLSLIDFIPKLLDVKMIKIVLQNDVSRKLIVLFLSYQNATNAIDEILPKLDEPPGARVQFRKIFKRYGYY